MASPARGIAHREEAGLLRDFYLLLWKQLDLPSGGSHWLDIVSSGEAELRTCADELLSAIVELQSIPDLLAKAEQDRQRVLAALQADSPGSELVMFKTCLGDRALDFAQQAAQFH